jgi:hypothetical protein
MTAEHLSTRTEIFPYHSAHQKPYTDPPKAPVQRDRRVSKIEIGKGYRKICVAKDNES